MTIDEAAAARAAVHSKPWPRPPDVAIALLVALFAFYSVLGLVVLAPEAVYSGDIGVKFVQARALADHRFTSLDIPYPGQFLDAAREFFPLRPPFVMSTAGTTQAIFPPAVALIQAPAVAIAGLRGLIGLSLVAAGVILIAAWRFAAPSQAVPVLVALGLGSPLWFYGVSGWEHAPAVAFGTAGFVCAAVGRGRAVWLLSGLLAGAGATLRDEALLLLPGLLLVVWLRTRRLRPLLLLLAATTCPLAGAAVVDVWWFERPVAAHLRHAVHLVQSAAQLTSAPNPDVPVLEPLTLRQRYETVVQYWLLGYGSNLTIGLFGLSLAAALAWRWTHGSSVGLLLWLAGVVALAAIDLHELVTAPKWLAGLHRVAPYLVFALLPWPSGLVRPKLLTHPAERLEPLTRSAVVLFTSAAYLLVAFAGVDTTGGKSLGPRLLLPLLPLLAVTAVARIADYIRSAARHEQWIGRAGVLLVGMAVVMHMAGAIPAYRARNHDDASAILAVLALPERIVVVDNEITAQLLLPLYYSKIMLLAGERDEGLKLGRRLAEANVRSAVLVTRRASAAIPLMPFDLERTEVAGRMRIQYWRMKGS